MKKGLKDTKVWALFTERPETIPLLFPGEADTPSSEVTVSHTGAAKLNYKKLSKPD